MFTERQPMSGISLRLVLVAIFGAAFAGWIWLVQASGGHVFDLFAAGYALLLVITFPSRMFSPLSFVHIYYGLWYVIAPLFAQRYAGDVMDSPEMQLALGYLFLGYWTCLLGCMAADQWLGNIRTVARKTAEPIGRNDEALSSAWIVLLYMVSTAMVALIVINSGGLKVWLDNPGDAFLNRQGTGLYVVISHYASMLLAALSGFHAYRTRNPIWLMAFAVWLMATSPVHGSKFQIILLLSLSLIPWIRHLRPLSPAAMAVGGCFVGIFFLGLYFRNHSWVELNTILPYSLNYFSTLDNFAMSLNDMGPGALETFFMPFRKLASPLGIPNESFYFDMNHPLTDMYFPHAWAIRATEQWPVEKDLYLNFGFFAGLPLLFAYLLGLTAIWHWAKARDTIGWWFVSITTTLLLISHLRGSLYNFNDFYMLPFLAVVGYGLRAVSINHPSVQSHGFLQKTQTTG